MAKPLVKSKTDKLIHVQAYYDNHSSFKDCFVKRIPECEDTKSFVCILLSSIPDRNGEGNLAQAVAATFIVVSCRGLYSAN